MGHLVRIEQTQGTEILAVLSKDDFTKKTSDGDHKGKVILPEI